MGVGKIEIKKYGMLYNLTKEKCDDCECSAFYGYRILPDLKKYYYKCKKHFKND